MSRECRRVHPDWEPERNQYGHYVGLFDGVNLTEDTRRWDEENAKWEQGFRRHFLNDDQWVPIEPEYSHYTYEGWNGERPDPANYMPVWTPEEATHWRMFETVSEGSPVSPPFATPEELAQWCADHPQEVYSGGTYEQWLAICHGAFAPSGVSINGGPIMTGVEAIGKD